MKELLRELRPLLIYLALGAGLTLLAVLATGKRQVTQPVYWDGGELPAGAGELSIPQRGF